MTLPKAIESLSRAELLVLIRELFGQNRDLQEEVSRLRKVIEGLQAEIAQLKREGKKQAAPFSKGKGVKRPKRSGRKPGQGIFRYREPPLPEEITEAPVDVVVAERICPDCGGELEPERIDFAYTTELPERPKPKVTHYRVEVCRCRRCGKQVRGRHPAVAQGQSGATAHRLGDRVMATAQALHYGLGVPMRKVPLILQEMTGVRVTQGAVMQDALRRAEGEIGEVYGQLRASVKDSERVNTDDTGWKVGGKTAYWMAFDTEEATVYQVRSHPRNEEVREVVPADYSGVMSTDRGRSYDAKELQGVKQQQCLGHIQHSISQVLETQKGPARQFGIQLKKLFKAAIKLWHDYREGHVKNYEAKAGQLKEQITHPLRERTLRDPDNQRLLKESGKHHRCGNLLRFLDDPRIEPTNNRAEQALRPAVIARKVSHCSKNERGADTFSAFKSVIRKTVKAGDSIIEGLYAIFCSAKPQEIPP
jgi:Transposase IS66 family.